MKKIRDMVYKVSDRNVTNSVIKELGLDDDKCFAIAIKGIIYHTDINSYVDDPISMIISLLYDMSSTNNFNLIHYCIRR